MAGNGSGQSSRRRKIKQIISNLVSLLTLQVVLGRRRKEKDFYLKAFVSANHRKRFKLATGPGSESTKKIADLLFQ